ncbi:C-X-C chemokine receptor type 3-2-like [Tiliqua scincoides]|uniref:C-X-C chemokine receptor type 3-2-like n=1 Tax=Tiliqua scincoides TaxID=71010 RepID=UPI0034632EA7
MNISIWDDDTYEFPTGSYPDINPRTIPCTREEVGAFARYFGPAILSLAFVVGLVGNGLVLAVLGRHWCPWHFADCFLFQLAMADLLLILTLPFWATQFTQGWVFGELLCKLLGALSTMNSYSTVFLLACISIERYFVIVHTVLLEHRWRLSHMFLVSAALWGICFGLSAVELHFRTVAHFSQAKAQLCYRGFSPKEANSWRLGLRFTSFTLGFLLPLLVMAYCYCRIFAQLCQARLFCKNSAVHLLLPILVLFILCWAPFQGFLLVDSLQRLGHLERDCAREKVLDFGLLFTESLGLLHSCLNPLVYAFAGIKFRRELSRLFHRWDRSEEQRQSLSSQDHSLATEVSTARAADFSIML